jgi:hypothetical protein
MATGAVVQVFRGLVENTCRFFAPLHEEMEALGPQILTLGRTVRNKYFELYNRVARTMGRPWSYLITRVYAEGGAEGDTIDDSLRFTPWRAFRSRLKAEG